MNTTPRTIHTVFGIVEHRGRTIAAHIPVPMLIFNAFSYAVAREAYYRSESINPEHEAEQRAEYDYRATYLRFWLMITDCKADVPLSIDPDLYLRAPDLPTIVNSSNVDKYIAAFLSISTVVPLESMDKPAFAIRRTDKGTELWLTDTHDLDYARLYPAKDIRIVEKTTDELQAIIASQESPRESMRRAVIA